MQTFLAALFIIVPNWKQPECPVTGEWVSQHGHAARVPPGDKGKGLLTQAMTRRALKSSVWSVQEASLTLTWRVTLLIYPVIF